MRVAVVADSTSSLPDGVAARRAHGWCRSSAAGRPRGIRGHRRSTPPSCAPRWPTGGSTSRRRGPPAEFAACYRNALDSGASAVVSVHLSRALSGTWDAARQAAEVGADRVRVVDSQAACMGLGYAVLAAADAAGRAIGWPRSRPQRRTSPPAAACSSPWTRSNACAAAVASARLRHCSGRRSPSSRCCVAHGRILPLERCAPPREPPNGSWAGRARPRGGGGRPGCAAPGRRRPRRGAGRAAARATGRGPAAGLRGRGGDRRARRHRSTGRRGGAAGRAERRIPHPSP